MEEVMSDYESAIRLTNRIAGFARDIVKVPGGTLITSSGPEKKVIVERLQSLSDAMSSLAHPLTDEELDLYGKGNDTPQRFGKERKECDG